MRKAKHGKFYKQVKVYERVVELEAIIEAFGNAMRSADTAYIASNNGRFTTRMKLVWDAYIAYAMRNTPL